ncbi:MAG TPA: hypothetical protein VIK33_12170 [Anaerolineae bacterium]
MSDGKASRNGRREKLWLLVITLLMVVITSLPYVYGYHSSPPDKQFMSIILGTPDTTQYFSWMRSFGRDILINNQMTAEPTESVFFNLLWWLLGQLSAATGWELAAVYQLFRLVTVATFVPLVYWVCSLFAKDARQRWAAFWITLLGAGLGWVLVVAKYVAGGDLLWPFDLYTVEPNSFLSLMAFPHFGNAATFIVITFVLFLAAFERRRVGYAIGAGLVGLILGLIHAYDLLLIYAVVGLYALIVAWRDKRWREAIVYTGIVGLISSPGAFYSFYITQAFPTWRDVLAQFVNAGAWTPLPYHLPILLGLPFILALVAFFRQRPFLPHNQRDLFLKVWFIVHGFIIYLPVNYQIHYLNGWQFPIAILASQALFERIGPWLSRKLPERLTRSPRYPVALLAVFLAVILPTNVYLFAWRFYDLSRHSYPYYLHRDEVAALGWLDQNGTPDDVVFSAVEVGQYIPGLTSNRAFLAHWAMTLDLYNKQKYVQSFYSDTWPDADRRNLLATYQVKYVLWGQQERALGRLDPKALPYLVEVFSAPEAQLYRVDLKSSQSASQD